MTISDPGLQAGADWLRDLEIYVSPTAGVITTGIEKVGSNNQFFYCSGSYHVQYFINYIDPSGKDYPSYCVNVPSGDINAQATFQILRHSDNSYDVYITFKNHDGTCYPNGCSIYNIQASKYYFIQMEELLRHETFSNEHLVWGSAWGYNQYQDTSLNWHYQPQENCNGQGSGGCAFETYYTPRFYWNIRPQDSSTGGEVYSCEYDPYPETCSYGS